MNTPNTGAATAPAVETSDIEARARRNGWRPEADWRGPAGRWLTADAYMEKIETEAPVLKERLRFLGDEVAKRDRDLHQLSTTLSQQTATIKEQGEVLRDLHRRTQRQEVKSYEERRSELRAKMRAARDSASNAEYDAAEAALDRLDAEHRANPPAAAAAAAPAAGERAPTAREPDPPAAPPLSQNIQQWIRENKWFTDPAKLHMNAMAVTLHGMNLNSGLSESESLAKVREEIEVRYPEEFDNPRRGAASTVAVPAGGDPPRDKRRRTVADLPPEARTQLETFKRLIPKYTDEEYLKEYQW